MDDLTWRDAFDEREQKSIDFALLYAAHYRHGEPGHLHLTIIAKLAIALDLAAGKVVRHDIDRVVEDISKQAL